MKKNFAQYGYPTQAQTINKLNHQDQKKTSMIGVGNAPSAPTTPTLNDQSGGHRMFCPKRK